jgi:predicted nucleic acid-binding protein
VILDTNAFSFRGRSPAILAILAEAEQLAIPVIVLGESIATELLCLVTESGIRDLLNNLPRLHGSRVNETTVYYADIHLELRQAGRPIPTNDIWIAALCRQHRLSV